MALFKSQVLTQASGSVGGVTYSHSKGGLYMRARAMPVDPNTSFQAAVRAGLTNAVNRWTEILSPAQRNGWETYAASTPTTNRLGDPIFLSGQNMYIRSQTVAQQALTKLTTGPANFLGAPILNNLGDFTTPFNAIADVSAGITATVQPADSWANEDDSIMLLFQGRPFNASRNYFRGPWRLVSSAVGSTTTPPTTIVATPAQITAGGYVFAVGQKVNLVVAVLRIDGRLSTRRNLGNFIAIS